MSKEPFDCIVHKNGNSLFSCISGTNFPETEQPVRCVALLREDYDSLVKELEELRVSRDAWKEDAARYCENVEYWKKKADHIPDARKMVQTAEEAARGSHAYTMVQAQAEDEGLWFEAETATEANLQNALRRLHAAVEADHQLAQERGKK